MLCARQELNVWTPVYVYRIKTSKLLHVAPLRSWAFKLLGLSLGRSSAICCFYTVWYWSWDLSLCAAPQRNFEIAFKMFDLNGDGEVDLEEFEQVRPGKGKRLACSSTHTHTHTQGLNHQIEQNKRLKQPAHAFRLRFNICCALDCVTVTRWQAVTEQLEDWKNVVLSTSCYACAFTETSHAVVIALFVQVKLIMKIVVAANAFIINLILLKSYYHFQKTMFFFNL